jgi:hypothetical protein
MHSIINNSSIFVRNLPLQLVPVVSELSVAHDSCMGEVCGTWLFV